MHAVFAVRLSEVYIYISSVRFEERIVFLSAAAAYVKRVIKKLLACAAAAPQHSAAAVRMVAMVQSPIRIDDDPILEF